ncbi:MAG TPA: TIGR01777 family protein [Anaerolineae bacterium]|nr:TIGR01777 family protein [Anaerolineae bacterium]HID83720.1 TIGR01777 family protein [Anaerolineales bacterium]HIQ08655.1 TIGR01777 family protein [Anaerolineaceae bacterium]
MRIAITGGTGLIGRALGEALLAEGHTVIVFTRRPDLVDRLPPGAQPAPWTPADPDRLAEVLRGADAVVNLVGENIAAGRWTRARKERIRRSRVEAGEALSAALAALPAAERPRVLLQASAVGYYGPRDDDEPVTEAAPPGNDFLAQVTVAWEASTAPVEALGVRRAILRTGVVLSPRGGALPLMALPVRLFVGGKLGSGRQWVPWIHIADEVAAIRFLLEREDAQGSFNLCAPNPVTNAEMMRALGRVLHRPVWLPVPAFALRLALGEMSATVLTGQRTVPQRLQELGFPFRYPRLLPALEDLLTK